MGLKIHQLKTPLQAYNVDGMENKWGTIKTFVELTLKINGRSNTDKLLVTGLGKEQIILGFPWLNKQNPDIIWKTGVLSWREPVERRFFFNNKSLHPLQLVKKLARQATKPEHKEAQLRTTITEEDDKEEHLNATQNPLDNTELLVLISSITGNMNDSAWINLKTTNATKIQAEINLQKMILPLEEQVPKEFHDYLDIFSEEKAARFPESWSWDHKIEMKDTFVWKSFKTYNLTPQEQIELDKFLKEILEKVIFLDCVTHLLLSKPLWTISLGTWSVKWSLLFIWSNKLEDS